MNNGFLLKMILEDREHEVFKYSDCSDAFWQIRTKRIRGIVRRQKVFKHKCKGLLVFSVFISLNGITLLEQNKTETLVLHFIPQLINR